MFPAYFNDAQRQATKGRQNCRSRCKRVLMSPTAALAYSLDKENQ
ncbi:MAG: Hsp70 family protein [Ignavibacteria bacterium]|nr:Hsp70 family protein [Ignavibacteria bacterium]